MRSTTRGTRTRANVKRTFSSFSTASAYRRWRGACASCHERYLRVGKEIWGQRRRSSWMRSATGVVVHEHARFFTNTRGINNILYDASSPRIAHRASRRRRRRYVPMVLARLLKADRSPQREKKRKKTRCVRMSEKYILWITINHLFTFCGSLFML